jgi:hypothetical protein
MRLTTIALCVVAGMLFTGCAQPKRVDTGSLLAEMTDLERLPEFPAPYFETRQFSSYDRASRTPDDPENWFRNADYGQFLRIEERLGREERVLMDAAGPGAIVRIWSANPKGTLRIYLDHAETPTIEVAMAKLLGGDFPGIPKPLAGTRSRGWNLYFPIPYAEHCKVTCDEGDFYYHINYRTYTDQADVQTFTLADLEAQRDLIDDTAATLRNPPAYSVQMPVDDVTVMHPRTAEAGQELAPGETLTWDTYRLFSGAIYELAVKVWATDHERALRELLLTIDFDDQRHVTVPLGDFFGGGAGLNPYTSLPMGVTADGTLWSRWVMPFKRAAVVTITNTGENTVRVAREVLVEGYRWTPRTQYFNAGWRVERGIESRPFRDWNYVSVQGQGVFVGAAFAVANPVENWWGEGDEKIYFDGQVFPSHFGTGTEDYFGYAWCSPAPFEHAYHNQPRCDGPGNYGYTAVNRWHVLDAIPFQFDFRFDMEIWHHRDDIKLAEASVVTYWYAPRESTSNREQVQVDQLYLADVPLRDEPRVSGAIEGEEMRIVRKTGRPVPQRIEDCSAKAHLWWTQAEMGDVLVLRFDAPAAGKYEVYGRFVKATDYGTMQLSINGRWAGTPIDFYSDDITVTPEIKLGEYDLNEGANTLSVEVVGRNENSAPKFMFGLDYLRLEPVQP